jgi:hypothetical protein
MTDPFRPGLLGSFQVQQLVGSAFNDGLAVMV